MILSGANQKLQVLLSGAVATTEAAYYAAYADKSGGAVSFETPVHGTTSGATAVDVVAAPGASKQRKIKILTLWNADTATVVATVRLNDGGTTRIVYRASLATGEQLAYVDGVGFAVCAIDGSPRTADAADRYGALQHPGHAGGSGITSRYAAGAIAGTSTSTLTVTADRFYALPFIAPPRAAVVNYGAIGVTTLAAGNVRVGLYSNTSPVNLYPAALLWDSGAISTGTTGAKSGTPNVTLTPGELYWAAALFDAAPTVRCVVQAAMAPILGHDSVLTNAPQCGYQASLAYAALPSTYPASAAALSGNGPAIYVGYGS